MSAIIYAFPISEETMQRLEDTVHARHMQYLKMIAELVERRGQRLRAQRKK